MRVLVVDDSNFQTNQTKKLLEKYNFEIVTAKNGKVALQVLEEKNMDGVLCDLLMPEMDGFEFLQSLRDKKIDIPVIIVSSNSQSAAQKRCEELGAKHFLRKPLSDENIEEFVRPIFTKYSKEAG